MMNPMPVSILNRSVVTEAFKAFCNVNSAALDEQKKCEKSSGMRSLRSILRSRGHFQSKRSFNDGQELSNPTDFMQSIIHQPKPEPSGTEISEGTFTIAGTQSCRGGETTSMKLVTYAMGNVAGVKCILEYGVSLRLNLSGPISRFPPITVMRFNSRMLNLR
jgi:hypothetical protein